jgi:glycosyltransferase involved in cell wall biosynthesis
VGNGRDPELFQPASFEQKLRVRQSLGIDVNSPLAVYAGSMGAQYCLEHMLRFMTHALRARPDAKLLCLTGQPDVVRSALAQHPILQNCVCMLTASAHEMPELIGCADLGLAFRTPSFSMKAVSPIKIGEYLLCGLPVLAGHDIGDTDDLASDVFRPIDSSNDQALEYAALWWLQDIHPRHEAIALQARCSGLKHFSLDATVKTYATTIFQVTEKHIY